MNENAWDEINYM